MASVTTLATRGAVLVEVDAGAGGRLDPAWLARWRTAAVQSCRHPDDTASGDESYVAARVRARRAGPLLALAAELAG